MKYTALALTLVGLMVLSACHLDWSSLNPLYDETRVVFDPALLGSWADDTGDRRLTLTRGPDPAYGLVFVAKDSAGPRLQALLVQFEGVLFLDVSSPEPEKGELYYPVHTFYRVVHIEQRLQLLRLDGEWLDGQLKANPDAIRHERTSHGIVPTASTRELQTFVIEHSFTEGAWDSLLLTRIETEPQTQ